MLTRAARKVQEQQHPGPSSAKKKAVMTTTTLVTKGGAPEGSVLRGAKIPIDQKLRVNAEHGLERLAAMQPWDSVTQDIDKLCGDTPWTHGDTPEEERREGSKRIAAFFGLTLNPKGHVLFPKSEKSPAHPLMHEFRGMTPEQRETLARMTDVMESSYGDVVFDPASWSKATSGMAPMLAPRIAIKDPIRRTLLSGGAAVVVKAYDVTAGIEPSDERSRDRLLEMLNGVVMGHAVNEMMSGYSTVLSPHFTYLLDWFIAPVGFNEGRWRRGTAATVVDEVAPPVPSRVAPGKTVSAAKSAASTAGWNISPSPWSSVGSGSSSSVRSRSGFSGDESDTDDAPPPPTLPGPKIFQYLVEENAGRWEFSDVGGAGKMSPRMIHAMLAALLLALEAFWLTMGGVHFDLHGANYRIVDLSAGNSIYRGVPHVYGRPNDDALFVIDANAHGDLFPVIFDFGRARGWVRTSKEDDGVGGDAHQHTVLMGVPDGAFSPDEENFGISRRNPQLHRDVQTLAASIICFVDFATVLDKYRSPEELSDFRRMVSMVGYMFHVRYVVLMMHDFVRELLGNPQRLTDPGRRRDYEDLDAVLGQFRAKYLASADAVDRFGSKAQFDATLEFNRLFFHDGLFSAVYNHLQYSHIICDKSAENLRNLPQKGGRTEFASPSDCLDLTDAWAPFRHSDKNGALPGDAVLTGLVKPSQVMRDPVANNLALKDRDIPASHRRFLPKTTTTTTRKGAASPLPGQGRMDALEWGGASMGAPACALCERPASLELSARPGTHVCSAVCGQMLLMHEATLASLSSSS